MHKYEMLGVIGEGAYGVVMRCRNTETGEIVAIKKFKDTEDDQCVKKTTARQIRVLRALNQTNIIQLKEAFRKKGVVCLVFQYVQNNLLEVLERTPGGLPPELIRTLSYQLLKGLAYMHSLEIIHRDIKPENLLVSEKKVLKLCDFGFARSLRGEEGEMTDYVATRWYRPPQLLVCAPYSKEVDIWAVGCIIAELVDGQPLFPGENEIDQLFLIQKCLGPLTPAHMKTFQQNPRFLGMRFPDITSLESLQKRYLGKVTSRGLQLLKAILKMDPQQRLTAIQAIQHPYFDGIREEDFIRRLQSAHVQPVIKNDNRLISAGSVKQETNIRKPKASPYQQNKFRSTLWVKKGSFRRRESHHPELLPAHSQSVNRPVRPKQKEKTLSLQKHQHRQLLAKTQAGFFLQSLGPVVEAPHKEEEEDRPPLYTRINKIYGVSRVPQHAQLSNGHPLLIKPIYTSEEEQNAFDSTSQLPFLAIGRKVDKPKGKPKPQNLMVNNYRH